MKRSGSCRFCGGHDWRAKPQDSPSGKDCGRERRLRYLVKLEVSETEDASVGQWVSASAGMWDRLALFRACRNFPSICLQLSGNCVLKNLPPLMPLCLFLTSLQRLIPVVDSPNSRGANVASPLQEGFTPQHLVLLRLGCAHPLLPLSPPHPAWSWSSLLLAMSAGSAPPAAVPEAAGRGAAEGLPPLQRGQRAVLRAALVCLFVPHRQSALKSDEKPVASVRPVQSTPIPMMPRHVSLGGSVSSAPSTNPAMNFPINYLQRAGVLVQKVVTTTGEGPLGSLPGAALLIIWFTEEAFIKCPLYFRPFYIGTVGKKRR